MAYVNIKQKSDLVNIRKTLQKRFVNEKIGEQDIYQENVKLLKPLKDIQKQQQTIKELPPAPNEQLLAIADVPVSSTYETLKLGRISDKYIKQISSVTNYDRAFGIKPIEGSVDFQLGKSIVKIKGNNFEIDKKQYMGTEGLWKLITLKNPGDVSKNDYDNYKTIMLQTKAFLKEDGKTVKSNRGDKYDKFIKPIYNEYKLIEELKQTTSEIREQTRTPRRMNITEKDGKDKNVTGTGFKFLPSDPNQLVNRHKILFSEMKSGNTNVFNELQAISDELLRLGIFDRDLIESINNFFLYNK